MFVADLHVHSRFSRACSKDCDIEHLSWWALRKGISVVGTDDFTHPAWADPGLLQRLQDHYDQMAATDPTARHLPTTGRSRPNSPA
jgi:DNA helicase-2/ATP-dependent DNA helicase PcrA